MPDSRLVPLPDEAVAQWAAGRATPLPQSAPGERLEHLEIHLDGVAVGGVVLGHSGEGQGSRLAIRLLETTLPDDDLTHWPAVLDTIEGRAAELDAKSVVTAVSPGLAATFRSCGYTVTMTGLEIELPEERILPPTERVVLRPMDLDERSRFVPEARQLLRAGMLEARVIDDDAEPTAAWEQRLESLADGTRADELLLTIWADGAAVGHLWLTELAADGRRGVVANTVYLAPEHRGRGLMREVYAAAGTFLRDHDLRRVRLRVYGHHADARDSLRGLGMVVESVHLRKDLAHPSR